jgi:hypothetical protein
MATARRGRARVLRRAGLGGLTVLETDNLFEIQQLVWYTIRMIAESAGDDPDRGQGHDPRDGRDRSAG